MVLVFFLTFHFQNNIFLLTIRRENWRRMNYWLLNSVESVIFIGTFLIAIYLLVPKTVECWRLWKKSGKFIYLSNSVGAGVAATFLLIADLLIFLRAVGG